MPTWPVIRTLLLSLLVWLLKLWKPNDERKTILKKMRENRDAITVAIKTCDGKRLCELVAERKRLSEELEALPAK